MKKVILPMIILMLLSLSIGVFAQTITVSGAGYLSANGTYSYVGVFGGKNYYRTGNTITIIWDQGKWNINSANNASKYYYNNAATQTPPTGGWQVGAHGTGTAPTLTGDVDPFPVELTSFTAFANPKGAGGHGVVLEWKTATEMNNHGFEVERRTISHPEQVSPDVIGTNASKDAWEKIGFVEGHGTTNAPQSYSFVDGNAKGTVLYRLKQIDRDGQFEYHNAVEIKITQPIVYALYQNYPNPFNPSTAITYSISSSGKISLSVYDMLGKEVATLVNGEVAIGAHTVQFNAAQLPSGMYFYTIRTNNFAQTKKMILVK